MRKKERKKERKINKRPYSSRSTARFLPFARDQRMLGTQHHSPRFTQSDRRFQDFFRHRVVSATNGESSGFFLKAAICLFSFAENRFLVGSL